MRVWIGGGSQIGILPTKLYSGGRTRLGGTSPSPVRPIPITSISQIWSIVFVQRGWVYFSPPEFNISVTGAILDSFGLPWWHLNCTTTCPMSAIPNIICINSIIATNSMGFLQFHRDSILSFGREQSVRFVWSVPNWSKNIPHPSKLICNYQGWSDI